MLGAMRRFAAALMLACAFCALTHGQDRARQKPDGVNEVLVTVNGVPITYQQIVGERDMQAEINAVRQTSGVEQRVPDSTIEGLIVHKALRDYVIQQLLDSQADKLQLKITDSTMRWVISRERKAARIAENDDQAWATFIKARYGLTPSQYRERRRRDIRRSETMAALVGARGPLQLEIPIDAYFSLAVTPRDVRRAFDKDSEKWRVSRRIDFEQFALRYPQETPYDIAGKLWEAVQGVYGRVMRDESLGAASDSLRKLLEQEKYPGVEIRLSPRRVAKDNTELDPDTYRMVIQPPVTGGVTAPTALTEEDEDGGKYNVLTFLRVYSREDGDLRNFEDVQVQEAIRNGEFQRRYEENKGKVEQALLRDAAIVPATMIAR